MYIPNVMPKTFMDSIKFVPILRIALIKPSYRLFCVSLATSKILKFILFSTEQSTIKPLHKKKKKKTKLELAEYFFFFFFFCFVQPASVCQDSFWVQKPRRFSITATPKSHRQVQMRR